MASYEQLSAQQRAIVDLVLKRGQSYDQLADTLDMSSRRVRELACEALTALAPVSAAEVDEDRRDELTDYLLNQQSASEAATTRSHLRRSEAARAWSRSVLDSLEHLYAKGSLPSIPSGEQAEEPRPRASAGLSMPKALSPEALQTVKRRRIVVGAALALLLLLAVLVWPIGLLTGGDDESKGGDESAGGLDVVGQVELKPLPGVGENQAGIAIMTNEEGKLQLGLQAQLKPSTRKDAYQVWLYNSQDDARSLGAQVADSQGVFVGSATLPDDYEDYRYIDISRELIEGERGHSGKSILRGSVAALDDPPRQQTPPQTGTTP